MTLSELSEPTYDKTDKQSPYYSAEFAKGYESARGELESIFGLEALDYLKRGIAIIPLKQNGKRPATKHGLNDWTDNPEQINWWWTQAPTANVGGVMGLASGGVFAIDLDVHEDAASGIKTLEEWEIAHGKLPETWTQQTGSGGRQLFYRTSQPLKNSANSELGVDVRGDGGYVVLPPSMHPYGEPYEWLVSPDDCDIATADDNVFAFLDHVRRNGSTDSEGQQQKFKLPDTIKKGERDDVLFRYASHLRAIGRSDEEISNAVYGVNFKRCAQPLDSKDVDRIVRSACKYPRGLHDDSTHEELQALIPKHDGATPKRNASEYTTKRGGIKQDIIGADMIKYDRASVIDGAPAIWNGKCWEFGAQAIKAKTLDYVISATAQGRNEVFGFVMCKAPRIEADREFDGKPYVQFANATYDIIADEIVEPKPNMFIIGTLPVNLNLDAEPNIADEFLKSIADNDQNVVKVLQEIIGACMCSKRLVDQSPMLIGRAGGANGGASNGKSTFINAVRAVLGTKNSSSLDISTLGGRFQTGRVAGKLANLGDDIPDGFLKGEELSTFKKLVTGDSIYADVKGADGFEFRPSATMVFSMNNIPRLADTTEGVYRRLAFVPFKKRFTPDSPEYDPTIAQKLAQPEALERLALVGLMQCKHLYYNHRFTEIPEMALEMENVRAANDTVLYWILETGLEPYMVVGKTPAELYQEYKDFCSEYGEKYAVKRSTFTQRFSQNMPSVNTVRQRIGGKQVRVYATIN